MQATLKLQNLKCGGRVTSILSKLNSLDGLYQISVNAVDGTVSFSHASAESLLKATEALARLGYPLAHEKNSLGRKAKSYVSCAIGRMAGS